MGVKSIEELPDYVEVKKSIEITAKNLEEENERRWKLKLKIVRTAEKISPLSRKIFLFTGE